MHTHIHTRIGEATIEGRRTRQMTGGLVEEIEGGGEGEDGGFFTLSSISVCHHDYDIFLSFSASVAAKICCSRLFRGGSLFLSLMGDASPPLLHPLLPPAVRIPFILISRSSSCTCHLLSSFRDKYCLIILTLILFRCILISDSAKRLKITEKIDRYK